MSNTCHNYDYKFVVQLQNLNSIECSKIISSIFTICYNLAQIVPFRDKMILMNLRKGVVMKKYNLFTMILVFLTFATLNGQIKFSGAGFNLGTNYLVGDSKIESSAISPNFALYSIFDLSPKMSVKFQAGLGKLIVNSAVKDYRTTFVPIEITAMYYGDKYSIFKPLVHGGLGIMGFSLNGSPTFFDGMVIGGCGVSARINQNFSLLVTTDMRYTTGDDFNGVNHGYKDGFFTFQTGLTYQPDHFKQKYEKKDKKQKSKILAQATQQKDSDYYKEIILFTKLENLENEFKKKNSQFDELMTLIKTHNEKLDKLENLVLEISAFNNEKNRTTLVSTYKAATKYNPVKEQYDSALKKYNSKNYKSALSEFANLFELNPDHYLASNFNYWIGECYMNLRDYFSAIQAFDEVLKYNTSSKKDDALLMSGISYIKTGDVDRAQEKLNQLKKQFPDSEYITKANAYLKSIKNKIIS